MKKLALFFVLLVSVAVCKNAKAQESILPDISETYIARLVARAEAASPHVRSNQERITLAQENIGKAKISYFDAFSFSYIYQPQGINTLSGAVAPNATYSYFNGIQAGVNFNLGTFLEKPYAVKQARHELQIASNDQNEYFLTLQNEVKTRYYTYVQAIANLKLATQNTTDAQLAMTDIKHKFEKGEATFTIYNQAQTSLTATFQAKIAAETALLIAKANLEELLGDKLENIR